MISYVIVAGIAASGLITLYTPATQFPDLQSCFREAAGLNHHWREENMPALAVCRPDESSSDESHSVPHVESHDG
jgi:hypothetical protein